MRRQSTRLGIIWGVAAALVGCGDNSPMVDEQEAEVAEAEQALVSTNMLSANALDMNALDMNALDMNALDMNALDMNALDMNALDMNALDMNGLLVKMNSAAPATAYSHATRGELVEELFRYIYGCAMPAGTTLQLPLVRDGQTKTVTFQGSIGLAPEWQTGPCDTTCQRWVSACVLARVNAYHVPIKISLRGNHSALATTQAEIDSYPIFEGKFYGNIFDENDLQSKHNACQGTGATMGNITSRACAQSGGYCSMKIAGTCDSFCGGTTGLCTTKAGSGADTEVPAIEVWLATPTTAACGNGACEAGETTANCSYDCTNASVVDHEPAGASATTMFAASLDGSNVVYAGITNSTSPLAGLSALDTGSKTNRDLFIVKANADGSYSGMTRWPMPTETPVAFDAVVNASGVGRIVMAISTEATSSLNCLRGSDLMGLWGHSLGSPGLGFHVDFLKADPAGFVHVTGTTRHLVDGDWIDGTFEYRKYSMETGQLISSRTLGASGVSRAPGDGRIYTARATAGSTIELSSFDATGQTALDTSTTLQVNGLSNVTPKAIQEGVFVAGNGTTASGNAGVFIGRVYPGTNDWAWQTTIAPDGNRAIEIHSMQVRGHAVVITGKFKGPIDFRGSTPADVPSARAGVNANEDVFVAAYEIGTGMLSWVRSYGGPGVDEPDAFTFDETNRLWFFGRFVGSPNIEGTQVAGRDGDLGVDSMRVVAGPLSLAQTSPIVAGTYSSMAVRDGQLWAWGRNAYGNLGLTTLTNIENPTLSLSSVVKASTGLGVGVALRADGTVWVASDNYAGTYGNGTTTPPSVIGTWAQVPGLSGIVDVAAGADHVLALQSNGSVWAWGANGSGQLGMGDAQSRLVPTKVNGLSGSTPVAVAAYVDSSAIVRADGTVYAWGYNGRSNLDPTNTSPIYTPRAIPGMTSVVRVALGSDTILALRRDGAVLSRGRNTYGTLGIGNFNASTNTEQVQGLNDIVDISNGYGFSTAARKDGTVWSWGYAYYASLGDGVRSSTNQPAPIQVANATNVIQVVSGEIHTNVRTRTGDMAGFGNNNFSQLTGPVSSAAFTLTRTKKLSDGTNISANKHVSLVVRNDDLLRTCGTGALGDATSTMRPYVETVFGLSGMKQSAVGQEHGLAMTSTGSVYAWGRNGFGQLGDGTWAERQSPVLLSGLSSIAKVAAGDWFSVVMRSTGTVQTFGDNRNYGLGVSSPTKSASPITLSGLGTVKDIAAGAKHALSVNSSGAMFAWGNNAFGQLGRGTIVSANYTPLRVPGLTSVVIKKVAASENHSVALDSLGNVWTFGANAYGQLGRGTTTTAEPVATKLTSITSVTAIATGARHTLMLRSDGTVWAVGDNSSGQLGDGTTTSQSVPTQVPGLTSVTAIAAGDSHSLVLKSDGTVWAFGSRAKGQLCDGRTSGNALVPVQVTSL